MRRNCSLEEISDGKLYTSQELVEACCDGCKGAAACCHGMGSSIILDPYDSYRLTAGLKLPLQELLRDKIELNLVDGIILPNLKMTGEAEGCAFLTERGKCSIHAHRPGICRIFPLGRYYENQGFHYFLQRGECPCNTGTKVKVSKWIDTPGQQSYEKFLVDWHYFLNDVESLMKNTKDEGLIKNLNLCILNGFYLNGYDAATDFYTQFYARLSRITQIIKA